MSAVWLRTAELKRGKFSPEENALVTELAERGLTAGQIAYRMNRHPSTINFAMHRIGLKPPQSTVRKPYSRRGRPVRSFTPEEDAFIEAMRCQGFSSCAIARLCNEKFGYARAAHTIRVRLQMLANKEVCSA